MDPTTATVEWMTVFADGPGGGNPCPVVFDFEGSPDEMQALAAGFGVETVFVFPGTARSDNPFDAELRYFVPRHEMEMCVHASIAASVLLAETGRFAGNPARIKTVLGVLDVRWDATDRYAVIAQFPAEFGEPVVGDARRSVLRALNIDDRDVDDSAGPIRSVSTARAKLIVPLVDEATVDGLRPDFERLWEVCDELNVTGFYPFARVRPSRGAPSGADAAARQFPRRSGYDEDPATGVAACGLGAYLTAQTHGRGDEGWRSWKIAQGRAMGRPSSIAVEALADQHGRIVQTRVGGSARRLGPGEAHSF